MVTNRKAGHAVFAAPCIICIVSYIITCNVLLIFLCVYWTEQRFSCHGYNLCLSLNSLSCIATERLIAIFIRARLWHLSEARWIQSTDLHLSLWRIKYCTSFDLFIFQVDFLFQILRMKFCIELFHLPTVMHNSLFINDMYVTVPSSTCFEH